MHHHIFSQPRGTLTGELIGSADAPYRDKCAALHEANRLQGLALEPGALFYVTDCECLAGGE